MKKAKSKSFQHSMSSGINLTKRSESLNVKSSGNKSDNQTESLLWIIWTSTSPAPLIRHIERTLKPTSGTGAGRMRYLKLI